VGNQARLFGLGKVGGGIEFDAVEFAVVVTATVTVSAGLAFELVTYGFSGSFVVITQLALGALVLQEK
jgi:hypothetical protein